MTFDMWWDEQDARFKAAMLREDMRDVWRAATLAEREACAKIADAKDDMMEYGAGEEIRMRSNNGGKRVDD